MADKLHIRGEVGCYAIKECIDKRPLLGGPIHCFTKVLSRSSVSEPSVSQSCIHMFALHFASPEEWMTALLRLMKNEWIRCTVLITLLSLSVHLTPDPGDLSFLP